MSSTKAGALVLLISFLAMIAAAVAGGIVGAGSHPVAGTVVGGFAGYITPSLLAHFVRKRSGVAAQPSAAGSSSSASTWLLLAAVATNRWVTDANRGLVEALRGITVAGIFGLVCGTLAVWGIVGATLLPLLAGAAGGAMLVGVLVACFELSS